MASVEGKILMDVATQTVTLNGSAVELDRNDNDFVAELKAENVQAGTTLDVKVQHSSDAAQWFDVAGMAFTQLVDSNGNELKEATGKVLKFVRAVATIAGATPQIDIDVRFHHSSP